MLRNVEITILVENRIEREQPALVAENGLSLYIATPESDLLFDTGSSGALIRNAESMGIDLGKKVNRIVFSHGHLDHTGGIKAYLNTYKKATVICHFNIFNRKFRVLDGGRLEVGIPFEQKELVRMGGTFIHKTHPYHLSNNILTTGEIPRKTPFEVPSQIHQQLVLQDYITDELRDDMALVLNTVKGLVILIGDCHSGVINTVDYARDITKTSEIYCILGGMNLAEASDEQIKQTVKALEKRQPRFIAPLHSTGFRAMNRIYNVFGERMLQLNVGNRLKISD